VGGAGAPLALPRPRARPSLGRDRVARGVRIQRTGCEARGANCRRVPGVKPRPRERERERERKRERARERERERERERYNEQVARLEARIAAAFRG